MLPHGKPVAAMACGRWLWKACGCSRGHVLSVCGACWARHTILLRLDPAALEVHFTASLPNFVGLILLLFVFKLRVFAHGLGVHAVKHFRESLSHAQHVRVLAFLEVFPRRQILESGHRKAFRAGEGDEGQAMLRRSLKSLATREIDDNAVLEREALRLVNGQRITRDNRELFPSLARAFLDAYFGLSLIHI